MTDRARTASNFATTSWTLVVEARSSPEALRVLLERYWSPVYAYYRRLGEAPDDAADLTQGFLTEVISDRRLLELADPERGRFRSFLKQSLRNHRVDEIRRLKGRPGARPDVVVPTDQDQLAAAEPAEDDDPFRAFDRQWAAATLATAVDRLERDCRTGGLDRHWEIFQARVFRPVVSGAEPESIDALVKRLGLRDGNECSKLLFTVKRKFREVLRDVVEETVADGPPGALEDELRAVQACV